MSETLHEHLSDTFIQSGGCTPLEQLGVKCLAQGMGYIGVSQWVRHMPLV